MTLKEFFRPTWAKIILVTIFAIIAFCYQVDRVGGWYYFSSGGLFQNPPEEPRNKSCFYGRTQPWEFGEIYVCYVKANPFVFGPIVYVRALQPLRYRYELETIFYLISGLIYWYILSCLLLFVYKKLKK